MPSATNWLCAMSMRRFTRLTDAFSREGREPSPCAGAVFRLVRLLPASQEPPPLWQLTLPSGSGAMHDRRAGRGAPKPGRAGRTRSAWHLKKRRQCRHRGTASVQRRQGLNPMIILAVAAGGAIGTIARYMVAICAGRLLGTGFPWATLFVNVTGSFLIGALAGAFALKWDASQATRAFLVVGIGGGYTTFSAFSLDFVTLMDRGQALHARAYAIGSSALSMRACMPPLRLMRKICPLCAASNRSGWFPALSIEAWMRRTEVLRAPGSWASANGRSAGGGIGTSTKALGGSPTRRLGKARATRVPPDQVRELLTFDLERELLPTTWPNHQPVEQHAYRTRCRSPPTSSTWDKRTRRRASSSTWQPLRPHQRKNWETA